MLLKKINKIDRTLGRQTKQRRGRFKLKVVGWKGGHYHWPFRNKSDSEDVLWITPHQQLDSYVEHYKFLKRYKL
jgi:hypothetical protein